VQPDPLNIYIDFSFPGKPPSPFWCFAMRILNICANLAICKRLWSVYGITLTKLRNCLGTETLTFLGELKMHIHDEHMRKETKTQMKCLFSIHAQAVGPIPTPTALVKLAENDNIDSDAAVRADTT